MREMALEEPGLFGEIRVATLFVFVSDNAAGVAAWRRGNPNFVVFEEVALAITVLGHLFVLDLILVAVGTDAPDMHGEDFRVVVKGDADDALSSTLRTEDLDDVAMMLDGGAVRGNGVGCVVKENDGAGLG
jgi:hypothetical protein